MAHMSVSGYYQMNWSMMYHHQFSLTELDNMMPWEREVYIGLTVKHLEEEKQRIEEENRQRG